MSFPDIPTLIWAKNKYHSNDIPGNGIVAEIREIDSTTAIKSTMVDGFLYKFSDSVPTLADLDGGLFFALPTEFINNNYFYDIIASHFEEGITVFELPEATGRIALGRKKTYTSDPILLGVVISPDCTDLFGIGESDYGMYYVSEIDLSSWSSITTIIIYEPVSA